MVSSKTGKNLWLQDIRKSEYAFGIGKTVAVCILMSYVFYESFALTPVFIPIWIFYMKDWVADISKKKEQEFRLQFRDSIQALASALKAGYSVENAIREADRDIGSMYGEETRIRKEYGRMAHQIEMNMPVSSVLEEFAYRTEQEDVENFVNVFTAAKKAGGDSISIIRNAVRIISDKIDTEKEIQTMLASKKLEFDIMCGVPFAVILYMKLTFGEFLEILYGNPAGTAIMSICLAVYIAAYRIGRKIISIEV